MWRGSGREGAAGVDVDLSAAAVPAAWCRSVAERDVGGVAAGLDAMGESPAGDAPVVPP
jgi:hypothetical protein